MTRKKLKLADLLAECDPAAPYAGEAWPDVAPVGREFGAHASDDAEQPPPESSWNYRVMKFTEGEERWHAIHEVHYRKGVPWAYTEQPASVQWDPEDGNDAGHRILDRIRESMRKPVLRPTDFA